VSRKDRTPRIHHLRECDASRKPWKNGRGETREIAISPSGADFASGVFDWRVSRAAVVEDGEFSTFPGHDRVIVLLEGSGLEIEHGVAAPPITLPPLAPYGFRGDWTTHARLRSGPVSDFNVFVSRDRYSAAIEVITEPGAATSMDAEHVLVHCVAGSVEIAIVGTPVLSPFETCWIERTTTRSPVALRATTPSFLAIVVRVSRILHDRG